MARINANVDVLSFFRASKARDDKARFREAFRVQSEGLPPAEAARLNLLVGENPQAALQGLGEARQKQRDLGVAKAGSFLQQIQRSRGVSDSVGLNLAFAQAGGTSELQEAAARPSEALRAETALAGIRRQLDVSLPESDLSAVILNDPIFQQANARGDEAGVNARINELNEAAATQKQAREDIFKSELFVGAIPEAQAQAQQFIQGGGDIPQANAFLAQNQGKPPLTTGVQTEPERLARGIKRLKEEGFTEDDPVIKAMRSRIEKLGTAGSQQGVPRNLEGIVVGRIVRGEISFEEGQELLKKEGKAGRIFKTKILGEDGKPIIVLQNEKGEMLATLGTPPKTTAELGSVVQLRKEFNSRPVVKQFKDIDIKFNQMEKALERSLQSGSKIATDQALITLFNKMTDPDSVVRVSEFARTAESQSLLSKIQGKIEKLGSGGAGLTDEERKALVDLSRDFIEVFRGKFELEKSFFIDEARASNFDPSRLGPDFKGTPVEGKFLKGPDDTEKQRIKDKYGLE